MSDWYPAAKRDPFQDGGSFTGGPPKGLIHTTEGGTYAGARSVYASKAVAPHFTISGEGGRSQVWQHVPISLASRALVNLSGGVQTNRDHVIQIEVVGFASQSGDMPQHLRSGLADLMRWIEANAGVPRACGVTFKAYPGSYGTNNGVRLSAAAWDSYSGWLGHQHAPENTHGDPGAIPIAALLGLEDDLDTAQDAKLTAIYNLLVGTSASQPDDGAIERLDLKLDALRQQVAGIGVLSGLSKTQLAQALRAMATELEAS